jgi:hypothetical protein
MESSAISTVTWTVRSRVKYVEAGSISPTLWMTVRRLPDTSTGSVEISPRVSIVDRGPLILTVEGSAWTRRIV